MNIILIILSFFISVLMIALSVRLVFYIVRRRKTKTLLSGERGRDGFLYSLFSSALGRKCCVLRNIYIRYEDSTESGIMCVPLVIIGSGGGIDRGRKTYAWIY